MTDPVPNFELGKDGLLPAIAQDSETGKVLMLAWMNAEAYGETVRTRRGVYYSRSRQELWRKGETSGHHQDVHEIRVDCDADAILLLVTQHGAPCHEGFASCFFRKAEDAGSKASGTSGWSVCEEQLKTAEEIYGKK